MGKKPSRTSKPRKRQQPTPEEINALRRDRLLDHVGSIMAECISAAMLAWREALQKEEDYRGLDPRSLSRIASDIFHEVMAREPTLPTDAPAA